VFSFASLFISQGFTGINGVQIKISAKKMGLFSHRDTLKHRFRKCIWQVYKNLRITVISVENRKRLFRAGLINTELEPEEVISTVIYSESTWKQYRNIPLYQNIRNDGIEI
jgi:hypothetical protein